MRFNQSRLQITYILNFWKGFSIKLKGKVYINFMINCVIYGNKTAKKKNHKVKLYTSLIFPIYCKK